LFETIDEIVKPEVYLDDGYLDGCLKVLEANMYCNVHINYRPLKHVAEWKLSIFEIRKKADSKVMPSIGSNASGGSRSQTRAPDARGTGRYSTKNKNTPVLQNRGLATPRSLRSLTPDLARDPAAFWPVTYDTTPFDILSRSNRLADYTSSYHLIQSRLERPLDDIDQQDGYVYLYEVDGNSGLSNLDTPVVPVRCAIRSGTSTVTGSLGSYTQFPPVLLYPFKMPVASRLCATQS
jgi:hypothetical protein